MKRLAATLILILLSALPARAEIDIQEVTSPGGLTAWLVEEPSIPFVALELRFRGGASLDAPGKRGAINLMTALIEEGAGDLDARAFAEARDALAASFRFDVGDDTLSVSTRFLTENSDAAVALLHSALTEPRFDPDAIERVRAQVLANLKSRATDPNALASSAFDALAYGDHPYGSYLGGTPESVAALTRDDIVEAFGRSIARDRVMISAVGDITADQLGTLLDTLLADLPQTGAALPDPVPFGAAGGITVVPFGSPQSVAQFGQPGISVDDPDFFAAYILNTILGGSGFNSRLMEEVREKRGLTYGIRTYLVDSDYSESIVGVVSSVNPAMAQTIEVVRAEWARIAEEGITEDELNAAKTYLTGAYPLRFDGNGPIARILVSMQLDGYPTSYVKTRNARIEAVTLDEVNRVAARLFDPAALRFVVVGEPEGVESTERD
ncbi:M16 family metallopeptidase [Sinisalibacter aestuarii]|uniref:Peptidase M16 n=1 Tax=Sinisalibacter aestuarii TaxID=2949426 RepID=A0ABQ5LRB0_9RHOB|nr:pitrilysin family protein [Sinisalibacter aestuarii]GKY86786.1 peptidase M16 [Sinisalibacter aestuarii]